MNVCRASELGEPLERGKRLFFLCCYQVGELVNDDIYIPLRTFLLSEREHRFKAFFHEVDRVSQDGDDLAGLGCVARAMRQTRITDELDSFRVDQNKTTLTRRVV